MAKAKTTKIPDSIKLQLEDLFLRMPEGDCDLVESVIQQLLDKKGPTPALSSGEEAVRSILKGLGEDLDRDGLLDTPKRVAKSWKELFGGYQVEPATLLKEFDEPCDEMVVLKDIELYSTCEHHMLPFFGKAHVGYIPRKGKVVGVSKLARLVDCFSRRLQIQERIGQQVVDALVEHLDPIGAACVIDAQHFCMMARGVGKQNSVMTTSALAGLHKEDRAARSEFLRLIGK